MEKARVVIVREYIIAETDEKLFSSFVEPIGRCIYEGIYEPGHPEADENGFRKDVLRYTKPLNLTLNRFPGGNYTSTYRWEDSVGPKEERPKRIDLAWKTIETNEFGINEFLDWSRINGSGVMMTVNLATRGVQEAIDCVEYCNFEKGTYFSDLRIRHGYPEPHAFEYWCLTNEIDGPWQIGQKEARDYALLARETAKAMKVIDENIKTVVCGSSSPSIVAGHKLRFPEFDEKVLDIAYDYVDYVSVHQYISNAENDVPNYLAQSLVTDHLFKTAAATCDFVKGKHRKNKEVYLSFDEFNTWHTLPNCYEDLEKYKWMDIQPLFEDNYNMEDAVMLGAMLLSILRHADRVKIACWSELVNCISHIRTAKNGPVWVLPAYYTYLLYSKYGRGSVLTPVIDSPKYDSKDFTDVPYLDMVPVFDGNGNLNLLAINRSETESLDVTVDLRGFGKYQILEHIVLGGGKGEDTNSMSDPGRIKPETGKNASMGGDAINVSLPKLSWNVIRIAAEKREVDHE